MPKPIVKKSGKRGSKYFDEFIRNSGPNFIEVEQEKNLRLRIPQLCRDIAYGNISIEKYGRYFTRDLIEILYEEVLIEYTKRYHIYMAMVDYAAKMIDEAPVQFILKECKDRCRAYEILYSGCVDLRATGNLSYIYIISSKLKNYRFSI